MKIGCDFDGFFSNCGQLKSDGAKFLYGLNIPAEKFKKELVVDTGILTLNQYRHLQKQIYETREIGLTMLPIDGVPEIPYKLQKDGHELAIVTSRGGQASQIAREWLEEKRLDIPLIGIGGGVSKAKACEGLDAYVDDDMDKLLEVEKVVPNRYLFSQGYNQHINLPKSTGKRINSWQHFYEEISSLK
jgi:uncharacterized HAD superfamily protein